MIARGLALAALLAAGTGEARFAPRRDSPYRLTRVEERDEGGRTRRFVSARQLVFTRDADGGYRALVTLETASDSQADSAFAALARAMAGASLVVLLDRAGQPRAVRDLDAIWGRLRAGITEAATDPALREALWRLHDGATTTQRLQVVAGPLLAVLAPDDADRVAGTRPVTLPAEGVGPAMAMTGEETVARDGGRIVVTTTATAQGTTGVRRLRRMRVVDRRSGLVVEQRDDQRLEAPGRSVGSRTRITLTPAPVS